MRVRVWADTHSTGLIDERGAPVRRHTTTLSDRTWEALQKWVIAYDHIIPLDNTARDAVRSEIDELDEYGLQLLAAVRAEWPFDSETGEPIDFTYFSEGRLTTLEPGAEA